METQRLYFITILTAIFIFACSFLFCISGANTVFAIESADGVATNQDQLISDSPSPLPYYSDQLEVHHEPFNPMINLLDQPILNNLDGNNEGLKFFLGGLFLGSVGILIVLVFYLFLCNRPPNGNGEAAGDESTRRLLSVQDGDKPSSSVGVSRSNLPGEVFTYEMILLLTGDFSNSKRIQHGHSGDFFLGVLENGTQVVIKRIRTCYSHRVEYHNVEMKFFNSKESSNRRFVPLLGHCLDKEDVKLMVYPRMTNEDLFSAFYRSPSETDEPSPLLNWITRMKIAIGVAEGLCYLHYECRPPLVHRDIKASSILLDNDFEVRLGSLYQICTPEEDTVITRLLRLCHETSEPVPSLADLSPPATRAYDVYCLGKILLGLVTGDMPISVSVYESDIAALPHMEQVLCSISSSENEQLKKIMDPNLIVEDDLLEEVWAVAIVAKSCLHKLPSRRPHMKYVLTALQDPLRVTRIDNKSMSARIMSAWMRGFQNATLA